jgi:hypothetical protein
MKIFLAGEGPKPFMKDNFYDFYRLCSYHYLNKKGNAEISLIHKFKDFILDSGIFTYLNGKESEGIDWEKYMVDYAKFVRENKIKNYVEIDIDSIVGLDIVEKLRTRLHKNVGWKSMPVWHMNRGYDKWLEICHDYEYICFGAFLTDGLSREKYKGIPKFLMDARAKNCKVHGLGFTSFQHLKKLKFYSVDSSSWTIGVRFGSISKYEGDKIKNITSGKDKRIIDNFKLSTHNFYEWIKYSNYAENNL